MLNEQFRYVDGELLCEDLPLARIAAEVGTPAYVYSAAKLRANAHHIQAAFAPLQPAIHYSLKANANLAIIRLLAAAGLGMDAVSGGEIFRALKAGVAPEKIVFAGVGKTAQEIRYALEQKIGWFNVESAAELALIDQIAGELGQMATVALRLNPEVQAKTHHHIATGHGGAKFGISAETISDILAQQAQYPHVQIRALHVHIGSQLVDVAETVEAVERAQALLVDYPQIRTLNIGGGLPVPYTPEDEYPAPEHFAQALAPHLQGWQVKLEPGRSIVANAGALLISTLYIKEQAGQRFVITDGSMTELIRPALYEAVHPIYPFVQDRETQPAVVVGPVCESADILSKNAPLPSLQAGDGLAVLMAGAYGMVMASNYNQRPRPPEVLIDGAGYQIIRQRETWDDLLRLEI